MVVIGLLTVLLLVSVILACAAAIKLIWHMIIGLIPRTSRRGLAKGLADLLVHVMAIPVMLVFLCIFISTLNKIMTESEDLPLLARYFVADLVIIVGLVVLRRLWMNHQQVSDRFAEMLSKLDQTVKGLNDDTPTVQLAGGSLAAAPSRAAGRWSSPAELWSVPRPEFPMFLIFPTFPMFRG